MGYELLKLLKDKKVADSYQFYETCNYKIYLAELSYEALKKVIQQYQSTETSITRQVLADAKSKGVGKYKAHSNMIDYLGVDVPATVVMDKLTMEIMSLLHNFFDTYAQWINAVLFAEKGLPTEAVSLVRVKGKMQEFPEYNGQFILDFCQLPNNDKYKYIADFNNTLKHRHQIYVENKFNILSVEGTVNVPEFNKDGRVHIKEDALTMILDKIDFCKKCLDDSKSFVETLYSQSDNIYTEHRMYNPKTFLSFKNEEDFLRLRSPENHYYFIEEEANSIKNHYDIMLTYDDMDAIENKSIECFNSIYSIIMIRKSGTTDIIGILKPEDGKKYNMSDEHELKYRKYKVIDTGYEGEMFQAICGEDVFHVYPMLSDFEVVYEPVDKRMEKCINGWD